MYISQETSEQTEQRLIEVLRQANWTIYQGAYFFEEFPLEQYQFDPTALAIVRDEEIWSQLVKTSDQEKNIERFRVFSFHFKDGADNSGFVGWLASTIKCKTGSGVFVVCGQNTNRGGIFDYWGCPLEVGNQIINLIEEMRANP
jgi:hypothetical protein